MCYHSGLSPLSAVMNIITPELIATLVKEVVNAREHLSRTEAKDALLDNLSQEIADSVANKDIPEGANKLLTRSVVEGFTADAKKKIERIVDLVYDWPDTSPAELTYQAMAMIEDPSATQGMNETLGRQMCILIVEKAAADVAAQPTELVRRRQCQEMITKFNDALDRSELPSDSAELETAKDQARTLVRAAYAMDGSPEALSELSDRIRSSEFAELTTVMVRTSQVVAKKKAVSP